MQLSDVQRVTRVPDDAAGGRRGVLQVTLASGKAFQFGPGDKGGAEAALALSERWFAFFAAVAQANTYRALMGK
jgi:hypothetical protein